MRHDRRAVIERGKKRLEIFLTENSQELNNDTIIRMVNSTRATNKEELFFLVGSDQLTLSDQLLKKDKRSRRTSILRKFLRNPFGSSDKKGEESGVTDKEQINTKEVYVLKTENGVPNYKMGNCCRPIPGDDVLGYINENNEVVVHKLTCETAMKLKSSYGGRLVQTRWETGSEKFLATLQIEGIDRLGILQEIIYIISTNMSINMRGLNIQADRGLFRCKLDVLIEDASVVTSLCKRLKNVKGVTSAVRIS